MLEDRHCCQIEKSCSVFKSARLRLFEFPILALSTSSCDLVQFPNLYSRGKNINPIVGLW